MLSYLRDEMLHDKDPDTSRRVMNATSEMAEIDINCLNQAHEQR
jgi:hypothetical protein